MPPSGTHRLCLAVWGPPAGIEDGEVAAGDDPAAPRWAWTRGGGFAGAGGGLGSPGREGGNGLCAGIFPRLSALLWLDFSVRAPSRLSPC